MSLYQPLSACFDPLFTTYCTLPVSIETDLRAVLASLSFKAVHRSAQGEMPRFTGQATALTGGDEDDADADAVHGKRSHATVPLNLLSSV